MEKELSKKDKDRVDNIISVMHLIEECLEINDIPTDISARAIELLSLNLTVNKNLMEDKEYETIVGYVLLSEDFNKIQ